MASARVLISLLLRDHPGLSDSHRTECLKIGLYKVSEAESKHKLRTRYMSIAALAIAEGEKRPGDSKQLIHEHVYQRAKMVKDLSKYKDSPDLIDQTLRNGFACIVTKEEDARLRAYKHVDGWERYRLARIPVMDTKEGVQVEFSPPQDQ